MKKIKNKQNKKFFKKTKQLFSVIVVIFSLININNQAIAFGEIGGAIGGAIGGEIGGAIGEALGGGGGGGGAGEFSFAGFGDSAGETVLNDNTLSGGNRVKEDVGTLTETTLENATYEKKLFIDDPCDLVDSGSTSTNINSSNYVPVTSDKMESRLEWIQRYQKWLVNKDCNYDRMGTIVQGQFIAKFTRDIQNAIKKDLFAGDTAFVANMNDMMQSPADTILNDIIYNDANIANACGPYKNEIKQALNIHYAKENRTDIDYLIDDVTCPLGDAGSHEAAFETLNNPNNTSWIDFSNMIGHAPASTMIRLQKDVDKAIDIEQKNAEASVHDGFNTLYSCYAEDGDTREGSLNNKPNRYYRTAISGEHCVAISPGSVIVKTFAETLADNNRRSFEPGNFSSVLPEVLALRVSEFSPLNSYQGLITEEIDRAYTLEMSSIEGILSKLLKSLGAAIFDRFFGSSGSTNGGLLNIKTPEYAELENLSKNIENANQLTTDLDDCIDSWVPFDGSTFNPANARIASIAARNSLSDLNTKYETYKEEIDQARKDLEQVKKDAEEGKIPMDVAESRVKAITEYVENRPNKNIVNDIKNYISEKYTSVSPGTIKSLLKECLTVE